MNMHHNDFNRQLPDAFEAEQALIGALLIRNDLIDELRFNFEPTHCCENIHRLIIEQMQALKAEGKSFSFITLKARLPDIQIGELTVPQYLAKLAADAVGFAGIKDWCEGITKCAARREAHQLGSSLCEVAFEDELRIPDDVDSIRARLAEVRQMMDDQAASFSLTDAVNDSFQATMDAMQGRVASGIDPGIPEVLALTSTWQKGQLIIIGGGVKQGKTALAMQCLFEIAKHDPVFLFSGEMTKDQLIMREKARRTGISERRQRLGKVSEAEIQELVNAGREIQRSKHIEIDCRKLTLDQFARRARALKKEHGIEVAFADHLTKFQFTGKMQHEEEHKKAYYGTSFLKDLAMELEIPIVALTHLKKSAFGDYKGRTQTDILRAVPNRRPNYQDLLGNIDKDADQVIIPFQPRPILAGMEPEEGTPEYVVWQSLMDQWSNKAEIILSLSRASEFPRRREVEWNGNAMAYGPSYKQAQNGKGLF